LTLPYFIMTYLVITPLTLLDMPQTVFLRLKKAGLLHVALLESVQPSHIVEAEHVGTVPRWSYITGPALAILKSSDIGAALYLIKNININDNSNSNNSNNDDNGSSNSSSDSSNDDSGSDDNSGIATALKKWSNPFEAVRDVLKSIHIINQSTAGQNQAHKTTDVTPPIGLNFTSGLVGYLGYDLVRSIEHLPTIAVADTELPDLYLYICDHVLAYEHTQQVWYFCTMNLSGLFENNIDRSAIWDNTLNVAQHIFSSESSAFETSLPTFTVGEPTFKTIASNYLQQAESVLEYIRAGDILQANLSHRIDGSFAGDSFALYQALTVANPAPYSAYIEIDDSAIVSVSPEQFLQVQHRQITAKPIKGTRPRYYEFKDDQMSKSALKNSIKDRAENVMIVDLMRNDIGRVAKIGSVKVKHLFEIEPHPSVWQMVSTVTASLHTSQDTVDLLKACWPPGSMTGAPKIRAMEIIDALEPVKRGVYAGAIGYFNHTGSVDLSVVIRTAIVTKGRVSVQVGGAIVADSNSQAELNETYIKGKKIFEVLGWNIQ
jgi:para-aminobenzoate synthetase component 1